MLGSGQPGQGKGALAILAGILILIISIFPFAAIANNGFQPVEVLAIIPFFLLIAAAFIAWGIVIFIKCNRSEKAGKEGQYGTCIVLDKRCIGRRYVGVDFYVTVEFISEKTGEALEHDALVEEEFYMDVKKGDVLECRILGNSCYVNPEKAAHAAQIDDEF